MTPMATPVLERESRRVDATTVAVSAAFGVLVLIADVEGRDGDVDGIDYLIVLVASAVLFGRRQHPLVVAIATIGFRYALIATAGIEIGLFLATAFALYELTQRLDRKPVYLLAVLGSVGSTVVITITGNADPIIAEFVAEAATFLLPVAWGDANRSRRERIAGLIEAEADRRVQAERIRIARDLHDVVAHAMTDIAVQSGVAAHLLGDDSPQARAALERINLAGRSALDDLRAMVGVLRSADAAPLRPAPIDPNDISDIVQQANSANIAITMRSSGSFPGDVGDACVVAAHRIIEEAVNNIARHAGPTDATVSIAHAATSVEVVVENSASPMPPPRTPTTGVGIIGMRERAESIGGTLTAGPTPAGGFVVTAVLPYRGGVNP